MPPRYRSCSQPARTISCTYVVRVGYTQSILLLMSDMRPLACGWMAVGPSRSPIRNLLLQPLPSFLPSSSSLARGPTDPRASSPPPPQPLSVWCTLFDRSLARSGRRTNASELPSDGRRALTSEGALLRVYYVRSPVSSSYFCEGATRARFELGSFPSYSY